MQFEKWTEIKRVDSQGVWEDRIFTLQECYEDIINTLWCEDRITTKEYDYMQLEDDIKVKLMEIENFGELYEFEFFALDNEKELIFNGLGTILGEREETDL